MSKPKNENPPMGLILCANKEQEIIELLELDKAVSMWHSILHGYLLKEVLEKIYGRQLSVREKILNDIN